MAHEHEVIDADVHFKINGSTRTIENTAEVKKMIVQGDHNSERFTFELPKSIDGHDMTQCDIVEIHYVNIDGSNRNESRGIYEVDDVSADEDGDHITFSWLISRNATKYVGTLSFAIRFACTTDGVIDYSWNTTIYSGVSVSSSIDNGEYVAETYVDILEKWKQELLGAGDSTINSINEIKEKALAEIEQARRDQVELTKAEIIEEGEQQIQAIIQAGSQYGSGS